MTLDIAAHRRCAVPGCPESLIAKGLCAWHYRRQKVGDLAALQGPRPHNYCIDCGVPLPRLDMRRCMSCRPEPQAPFVNPMVCVCTEPDADLGRDFGMCSKCKRKPLALMAVAS